MGKLIQFPGLKNRKNLSAKVVRVSELERRYAHSMSRSIATVSIVGLFVLFLMAILVFLF